MPFIKKVKTPHSCNTPLFTFNLWTETIWQCPKCEQQWMLMVGGLGKYWAQLDMPVTKVCQCGHLEADHHQTNNWIAGKTRTFCKHPAGCSCKKFSEKV